MAKETWVLVEQWRGRISEGTYEGLALGREVAGALGGRLHAVILGSGNGEFLSQLGAADEVLVADHAALAEPVPDVYAVALAQLIPQYQPEVLLIPQTNVTMEVGALLAARLGLPYVNSCRDVQVADGRLVARCILCGGKVEATMAPQTFPAVLGILPGSRPHERGRVEGKPSVTPVALDLPVLQPSIQFRGYTEPAAGDVDITQQDVLVSIGRGLQRAENLSLAEELAEALGGAVSGSRPVIDQGWLPSSRQVGTSGMVVKPKLYLALGISGAPEHVQGMKDAALIIAINTDARAPIFGIAHYGAVADMFEVVPLLIDRVKQKQAA